MVQVSNSSKLFVEDQMNWNESIQIQKFFTISQTYDFRHSPLHKEPVDYIFLQGTQGISEKTRNIIESVTKRQIRHKLQVKFSKKIIIIFPLVTDILSL